MNHEEFRQYISYAIEDYAKDKIASGNWSEDEAIDLSREHLNDYYPMVRRPKIIIYRLSSMTIF